jgi:hypothetical protein
VVAAVSKRSTSFLLRRRAKTPVVAFSESRALKLDRAQSDVSKSKTEVSATNATLNSSLRLAKRASLPRPSASAGLLKPKYLQKAWALPSKHWSAHFLMLILAVSLLGRDVKPGAMAIRAPICSARKTSYWALAVPSSSKIEPGEIS